MTLKQRKVAKLVEKAGSMKEAMLAAGYSPNTAKTPAKVTGAKGWQKLLDEKLPDEHLLEVHQKLLNHEDWQANSSGLDKAYKIKGKYTPDTVNQQFNVGEMSVQFKEKE